MAEHRIEVVPRADGLELMDVIDRGTDVSDDMATIWGAETQLRQMTRGDVELLIRDVERYHAGVQYGNGYLSAA
jgi:hypothetical protein